MQTFTSMSPLQYAVLCAKLLVIIDYFDTLIQDAAEMETTEEEEDDDDDCDEEAEAEAENPVEMLMIRYFF